MLCLSIVLNYILVGKRIPESWIIVTKLARIMNLCSSAQESRITRLWEKLNKIDVWINCVRSREWKIWRFRPYDFQIFCLGSMPRNVFGADSPLVSPVILVLNVQLQKTPHLDKTNDDTEKQWSKIYIILDEKRSLNTKETIQNETM